MKIQKSCHSDDAVDRQYAVAQKAISRPSTAVFGTGGLGGSSKKPPRSRRWQYCFPP